MRGKHSGGGGVALIGRRRDGEEMEERVGKDQRATGSRVTFALSA